MHNYIHESRQIFTQSDLNDRGVYFHVSKNLDIFADVQAPLTRSDQHQLAAFMVTVNALRDAILVAQDNLKTTSEAEL